MADPIHCHWYEESLPDGRLSMREGEGEGHPQAFAHPAEMPADLTKA
jgi:hypothetical protein